MKLLLPCILALTACGGTYKVKGTTTHNVVTTGETKVTISLDISACKEFTSEEAQMKCLDMLVEMMATLNDLKELEDLGLPVK